MARQHNWTKYQRQFLIYDLKNAEVCIGQFDLKQTMELLKIRECSMYSMISRGDRVFRHRWEVIPIIVDRKTGEIVQIEEDENDEL